jgi:hypothetical protein
MRRLDRLGAVAAVDSWSGRTRSSNIRQTSIDSQLQWLHIFRTRRTDVRDQVIELGQHGECELAQPLVRGLVTRPRSESASRSRRFVICPSMIASRRNTSSLYRRFPAARCGSGSSPRAS